jgi:uncharacterized protein
MRRIVPTAALCAVAALAAGCASPSSHLYTLTQAPAPGPAAAPLNIAVLVGPVTIPAIVDLPPIVVTTGPNQVTQDQFNRWASPLSNNISRVVVADLVAILGTPRVSVLQDGLQGQYDYRVVIAVQSFESAPGDAATVNVLWTVRRTKDDKTETGGTNVREPSPQKGYDALAAAHSRALARVSQDIADMIRTMERGAP